MLTANLTVPTSQKTEEHCRQQLKELDFRLGKGEGAKKERTKLEARIKEIVESRRRGN